MDESCYIVLHVFMFRMLLGYISPLGIFTRMYMSLGYSVFTLLLLVTLFFVFTDEGDCKVTETFGSS